MSLDGPTFAGIEAGGTKFVCAFASGDDPVLTGRVEFPTEDPGRTLARVDRHLAGGPAFEAIGLASFGPVDLRPSSSRYGHITTTPKRHWRDVDVLGHLRAARPGMPIGLDTDVNAAALAEHLWGAARGAGSVAYITVGTGIGVGLVIAGQPVHGLMHPEAGHIRIPHDGSADPFAGICPFHRDCWEGLASGPAIEQRWGARAEDLPVDHPAWDLEAHYLACGLINLILTVSPEKVVVGGGVGSRDFLLERVRRETVRLLGGYLDALDQIADIDDYLVPAALGRDAGVLGAIALARREHAGRAG